MTVAFATGVAALHGVFFTLLRTGDHVIVSDVTYEAVWRLFSELLPERYGIEASFVDVADDDAVREAIRPSTKLIHVATIANPTTKVADISSLAAITHYKGLLLSVDATFTHPPFFRTLEHGADLAVHSLTKYINGHGDAMDGVVTGNAALIDRIRHDALVDVGGVTNRALGRFWELSRTSSALRHIVLYRPRNVANSSSNSRHRELLRDTLEEERELVEFDVPALPVLLKTFATVAGAAGKCIEARFDHRDIRPGTSIGDGEAHVRRVLVELFGGDARPTEAERAVGHDLGDFDREAAVVIPVDAASSTGFERGEPRTVAKPLDHHLGVGQRLPDARARGLDVHGAGHCVPLDSCVIRHGVSFTFKPSATEHCPPSGTSTSSANAPHRAYP